MLADPRRRWIPCDGRDMSGLREVGGEFGRRRRMWRVVSSSGTAWDDTDRSDGGRYFPTTFNENGC